MGNRIIRAAAGAATLVAATSGAPAYADGVQPWPQINATVSIDSGWRLAGELTGRAATDDVRSSQAELRLLAGHTLGKHFVVWAGYTHIATYVPGAPDGIEEQGVQQLNWSSAAGPFRLSARTRLEERFIRDDSGTGLRLRQQLRAALPLGKGRPSLVVWTEPFFGLVRTRRADQSFDQIRTFAGISVPISRRADVEFGYLNQYLHRSSGDISIDAVPVVLNFRF